MWNWQKVGTCNKHKIKSTYFGTLVKLFSKLTSSAILPFKLTDWSRGWPECSLFIRRGHHSIPSYFHNLIPVIKLVPICPPHKDDTLGWRQLLLCIMFIFMKFHCPNQDSNHDHCANCYTIGPCRGALWKQGIFTHIYRGGLWVWEVDFMFIMYCPYLLVYIIYVVNLLLFLFSK